MNEMPFCLFCLDVWWLRAGMLRSQTIHPNSSDNIRYLLLTWRYYFTCSLDMSASSLRLCGDSTSLMRDVMKLKRRGCGKEMEMS